MVYIHFPSNLTEEELMLQTKYQKLKKKKKAIQALKTPKQESEKPLIPKRPADARDAREVARKLLKSGAIQAIQKPSTKQDQTSFKRPKGQERKRPFPETNVALYQPFTTPHEDGYPGTPDMTPERETPFVHGLYQQFATTRDRGERGFVDAKKNTDSPVHFKFDKQAKNTIFISGTHITEEYLNRHFCEFGNIINTSMEIDKGHAFITYKKPESSERAINEMHGKTVGGIALQVQLARRQPKIDPINDASAGPYWCSVASSNSPKGPIKDTREPITYDDMF